MPGLGIDQNSGCVEAEALPMIAYGCQGARRTMRVGFAASFCIAAVMALDASQAQSPPSRDSATEALSGHQAEQLQYGANADPLRRPLFYDPVDIESEPPGVPCNHLAQRRPDRIAGQGHVVLLKKGSEPARHLRFWAPPGAAANKEEAVAQAFRFAGTRAAETGFALVAVRAFAWCKGLQDSR